MFLDIMQIVTVALVALAMIPAVAHALELPGKMRLGKDNYFAVQRIYYPGFTFAGISEPVSSLSTILLLFLTPRGTAAFWLTLLAFVCLLSMQAVYWIVVHPVNKVWVQGESMSAFGAVSLALAGRSSPELTRLIGPISAIAGNMHIWFEPGLL